MKYNYFKILVLFCSMFLVPSSFGQGKQYQGRLWKITGNGLSNPSYLYGTMHVSRKVSFHLSDSFFLGIKNSDIIALESDPSTWMDHFYKRTRKAIVSSWSGGNSSSNFYNKAFDLDYPNKNNLKWLFRSENRLTNGMLYRSSEYTEDYEEDTYLDLFIFQAGKKLGKGIASLENNDTVRYLEKLANKPTKEDIKNRKKYKRRYGMYTAIEDAYRDGDLDLLDSLNRLGNPTSVYHHYFIDERNRRMAIKMDSIMQSGKTVFSGVGAAHLPGDVGMIKLFREMGYTVLSVTHEEGKIAKKTKEQIEKLKSPVNIKSFTSSDGAFKLNVPEKLYENHYSGGTQYYYPDMGNGGFYQVNRIKHFMSLQEKDEALILKQLDSLFFENIPGKILEKKKITVDGFSGYDLMNVTKKGDYQRHAIFVSPLEIFYFKAHANGTYMEKESDKFINSIHFFPTKIVNNSIYKFTPTFGEFELDFPAIPYYSTDSNAVEATNSDFGVQCFDPKHKEYYLLMKTSLTDYNFIEEDSFELGRLSEKVLEDIKYDSLISYNHRVNPYAQLLVEAANKKGKKVHIMLSTIGKSYYLLLTDAKDERALKYFNSFKRKDFKYKHSFREFVDTNLYVKVNINYDLEPQDEFENAYSYYSYYGDDEEKQDKGHQSKSLYLYFISPETGENAVVSYYKHSKYYTAKDSTYWKNITEYYTDDDNKYPLKISRLKVDTLSEIKTVSFLLTDTGSSKGIMNKTIIKGGVKYEISSLIDTIAGPSLFIKEVFKSLEPLDTIIGNDIFMNKNSLFIQDLFSEDTIPKQHAEQSIDNVDLSKKELDSLIIAFDRVKFEKKPSLRKAELLETIGGIKDDKALPFFEKVYKNSVDTFILQVATLEALAKMESEKSFSTFKNLLLEEAPLTDNTYKINSIFYELNDTLELAANLYPDILELTSYPEYKSNIYSLLAQLIDSNKIDPNKYRPQLRKITREAKDELKRQYASESKSAISYYGSSDSYDDLLDDFVTILAPFYNQEDGVKEYFKRQLRSQNKTLKMNTVLGLTKNNVMVNDTFWRFFSDESELKVDFYNKLHEQKKTHLFKNDSTTQADFARCNIVNKLYKYDQEKDTIVYLSKRLVLSDDTSGYMYFFKIKQEDDSDWSLGYSGMFSPDTAELFADAEITSVSTEISNKDDVTKLINEEVKLYRWLNRKRIPNRRGNRYNYLNYDY